MCTVARPKCARAQLQQLTTPTRVALIGIDMMAFQCSLCQYFSPSLALHVSHLRLVHSRDPSFYLMCGIDSCLEEFRTFSSFNSHVYRCHRIALGLEKPEKESIVPPSVSQASNEEFAAENQFESYYEVTQVESVFAIPISLIALTLNRKIGLML